MALRKEDLSSSDALVVDFPLGRAAAGARRARLLARRRRTLGVLAAAVVGLAVLSGGPDGSTLAARPGAPRAVVLGPGDTLWDVAERYAPPGVDRRAFVDALADLNDLGPAPAAGSRIRLPR